MVPQKGWLNIGNENTAQEEIHHMEWGNGTLKAKK